MKVKSIWMRAVKLIITVLLALPLPTIAQTNGDTAVKQVFTQEQLAQLLAPIALYPDELIAQVLMASTYPLEVVMAERWVQQHLELKGDALATALEEETWDPSVKSLVNFPTVLTMLSQKLDLTTKLGDAFLEQNEDVMATVQLLRSKALAAGNLKTGREQKVLVEEETIIIEPAEPQVIYVPSYDPYVVYGPWWYPAYPPYYFYPPLYPGSALFSYGSGVNLGFAWGYAWGGWNWPSHTVIINVNRNVHHNRHINRSRYIQRFESRGQSVRNGQVPWRHDPDHRRGVAYKLKGTAREFGQLPARRGEAGPEPRGFSQPGRRDPVPRTDGIGSSRRGSATVHPLGAAPLNRSEKGNGGHGVSPGANRESVFTGGDSDANRARRSSERGRQSVGSGSPTRNVPVIQPGREFRPGGGSAGSGSRGGFRGDGKGRGDNRGR